MILDKKSTEKTGSKYGRSGVGYQMDIIFINLAGI